MSLLSTVIIRSRSVRTLVGLGVVTAALSTGVAFGQSPLAGRAPAGSSRNESPYITLADVGPGGKYVAPATLSLRATASDVDGTIRRVDFYVNDVLLKTRTAGAYDFTAAKLAPGTYPFIAVARDNSGNVTVSNTVTITVEDAGQLTSIVFTPSTKDASVLGYVMNVFRAEADPTRAAPIATQELGKPPIVNGECTVDVHALMAGLPHGTFISVITAVAVDGSAQSGQRSTFTN